MKKVEKIRAITDEAKKKALQTAKEIYPYLCSTIEQNAGLGRRQALINVKTKTEVVQVAIIQLLRDDGFTASFSAEEDGYIDVSW